MKKKSSVLAKRPKRKRVSKSRALAERPKGGSALLQVARDLEVNLAAMAATKQFSEMLKPILDRPTPPNRVKRLPKEAGKKGGIAYVDDGYVRDILDEAFGKTGWEFTFELLCPWEMIQKSQYVIVTGTLKVLTPVGWVSRSQCGTGRIQFTRAGELLDPEIAFKGAATDALKKCANYFGIAEDVYSGAHNKVKQMVVQDQKDDKANEMKVFASLPDHVKPLYKLAWKIINSNRATKEAILSSLSMLLPKKVWKGRVPNLHDLTVKEVETIQGPWQAVLDGVGEVEKNGMIRVNP